MTAAEKRDGEKDESHRLLRDGQYGASAVLGDSDESCALQHTHAQALVCRTPNPRYNSIMTFPRPVRPRFRSSQGSTIVSANVHGTVPGFREGTACRNATRFSFRNTLRGLARETQVRESSDP
jgi:hypothetical protein